MDRIQDGTTGDIPTMSYPMTVGELRAMLDSLPAREDDVLLKNEVGNLTLEVGGVEVGFLDLNSGRYESFEEPA